MKYKSKSRNNGIALPLALISVMLLLIIGVCLLELGVKNRIFAIRNTADISARCAADSGLTKAIFEMKQKIQGKAWLGSAMPLESGIQLINSNAAYTYTTTKLANGNYLVESTGVCGVNTRTVSCILEKKGAFETAIFADGFITLKNSGKVGSYNGTVSNNYMVGTNSTEDGAVALYNSAYIDGGVIVGAGGDPDDVITLKPSAKIDGEITSLGNEIDLAIPEVPELLLSSASSGVIKNNITLHTSSKYSEIDLKSNNTITVDGNVELYVTGDLTLGNSSKIEILDGSSLTIYLDGNLIGKNSCEINNNTEIPKNLQIYGMDNCTEIDLRNSSNSYGVIYAPNADFILHNSVTIYGSVICDNFEIKNSGQIMYDASLEDETFGPIATDFSITNWNESIGE